MSLALTEFWKLKPMKRIEKRLAYYRQKKTGVPVAYLQDVYYLLAKIKKKKLEADVVRRIDVKRTLL